MVHIKKFCMVVLSLLLLVALATPMTSQQRQSPQDQNQTSAKSPQNTPPEKDRSKSSEADRARESAEVLNEVMKIPENSIPEELMARAHGIAVIPHVVKGAFGIGGQWGKGLMSQRKANGMWSAPAFIEIGGGSFGLQIGVQATDVVLVFTDDTGLRGILKGKVKLGADASATAGPVGRKAEVGTDVLLRSGIFAYSRSKGLFAGISLDGSVIGIDEDANRKVYGKSVTAEQLLTEQTVKPNATVQPFVAALQKASPTFSPNAKK